MKPIYLLILTLAGIFTGACSRPDAESRSGEQEVHLTISTSGQSTRAAVPDPGVEKERRIDELDLLIFKENKFQYSRKAFKVSGQTYKVNLKADNATLTAQVFANCRGLLTVWEGLGDQGDKSWETIQSELIDIDPARLVSDRGEVLPMWGQTSGTVSQTHVSGWDAVSMLRSVASVDIYIEQNTGTADFILTDAHLYYAPDRGFLAPEPSGGGYKVTSPPEMQTVLNTLRASGTAIVSMAQGSGVNVSKEAIANQLYLYDNDIDASNYSPVSPPVRKYTRLIVAGYYDQPIPDPDPVTGEDRRIKTYYPLDFVDANGDFHDIKRNYKYVFEITRVHGEGYGSVDEAADEYPVNMDVDVTEWNRQDEYIGVQGKYYLSMERRDALLWSKAGSTDELKLTYEILDDTPGESFRIAFTSEDNGVQTPPAGTSPWPQTIQNDYFRVSVLHDLPAGTATFIVEALQDHSDVHDTDMVEVRFRDLRFYITITQLDKNGWDDGGEIPTEF